VPAEAADHNDRAVSMRGQRRRHRADQQAFEPAQATVADHHQLGRRGLRDQDRRRVPSQHNPGHRQVRDESHRFRDGLVQVLLGGPAQRISDRRAELHRVVLGLDGHPSERDDQP
jgi:hypothetical protein